MIFIYENPKIDSTKEIPYFTDEIKINKTTTHDRLWPLASIKIRDTYDPRGKSHGELGWLNKPNIQFSDCCFCHMDQDRACRPLCGSAILCEERSTSNIITQKSRVAFWWYRYWQEWHDWHDDWHKKLTLLHQVPCSKQSIKDKQCWDLELQFWFTVRTSKTAKKNIRELYYIQLLWYLAASAILPSSASILRIIVCAKVPYLQSKQSGNTWYVTCSLYNNQGKYALSRKRQTYTY